MNKCIGCGARLQSDNPNEVGYVNENVIYLQGEAYCKRCYDIIHHHKSYVNINDEKMYFEKIKNIKNTKSLVILMVDCLNLNSSFITNLADYIGSNKVLILINKIDLLPNSTKLKKLEMYVKNLAEKQNLKVASTMLISSLKGNNVDRVIEKIRKLKYSKTGNLLFNDCYVLGYSSVGKSTFINQLLKTVKIRKDDLLTTSSEFNTTVDFIKIPLDKKSFIIDTMGIINKTSFLYYLDNETIRHINPKGYIKNKVYQLSFNQTIFVGGLVKLDFLEGEKITLSTYLSNELYIHRTKYENSEELYHKQVSKLLLPPNEEEFSRLGKPKTTTYYLDGTYDIELSGLGFIHLKVEKVKLNITTSENVKIYVDKSVI